MAHISKYLGEHTITLLPTLAMVGFFKPLNYQEEGNL